jgi:hypothetical protein
MPETVCGAESLPSGTVLCELVSVEETQGKFNDPAWRWTFECPLGEQAGRQAKKTTGVFPAPDNAAGQMIGWLLGRPFRRGERCNTDDLLGQRFMVTVAGGQIVRIKPVEVES